MPDGRHHPFAAEPVERPNEYQIEPALVRVGDHRREPRALLRAFAAARMVNILADDLMAGGNAPRAKLGQLVFRVLSFVLADARVDGYAVHRDTNSLSTAST